ncbi:uncharacterized protein CCOS01_15462 [Colletotrichum costaricense]|uniref:NmrA-like domain-containing protein n=1 Tax=Colletotrichum costaricense TaxID=1209916 RepID=A0AAI9YHB4_9PEZI|nr:uncharacterized protein CCOS01_15462 [Colletotrichum costaricense]KAK1509368.1 hypothetical protein CCOS01_15462 [Colletotrichum costaricense]
MTKLIVVCGVTGNQGRSVAETYLKEVGWRVRGITRDATKPASLALAAKGVEIVEGDLDDAESLKAALQGANIVFGNTVFPFMLALTSNPQLKPGQSVLEWAYELEVQQGKNLVEAVAKLDSLQLFIWSTLSATRKWSGGKFQNVYHFDSKAAVVDHRRDGTMVLRMPGELKYPIPHVLVHETGKYVKALAQASPGTHLLAYSEFLTWPDYVSLWGRMTGVPAVFESITMDDMDKLAPGGFGLEIGEMHAYSMEFGYWGNDPSVIYPEQLGLKGELTTIANYIKGEDWSELLGRPAMD